MTKAKYYPGADTKTQNFGSGNVTMGGVTKVVLHTTETAGWPGYGGAGGHPTLTFNPWLERGKRWRQHLPLNGSATALKDPDGTVVRENRDDVAQVEIVCYCDPNLYKKYGKGVVDIPNDALKDLAEFLVWVHKEWDMPLRWAPKWTAYPASINYDRWTGTEYDTFKGILGHCHVSGNVHGDPGALDVEQIKKYVTDLTKKDNPVADPKVRPTGKKLVDATLSDFFTYDGIDAPVVDETAAKPNYFWAVNSYIKGGYNLLRSIDSSLKLILAELKKQ